MAYNEEANIGKILSVLNRQKLNKVKIEEIVVVASGCTDKTEEIVRNFSEKNKLVKLIVQERREGKAAAINLFLKQAKGEIIILESADTIPAIDAVENIVVPFSNPKIGAVGAQVIPVNQTNSFIGFYVGLFWKLHHLISLKFPKCGEMVAFRNLLPEIAYDTATDETWIIALLLQMGYQVAYAQKAVVYNKGPQTLSDFFKQRRRHLVGYIHLKKQLNFRPKTMDNFYVVKLLAQCVELNTKNVCWTLGIISLEAIARMLALYDWYICKQNPYIWDMAQSTKEITEAEFAQDIT